uniref:Prokineticin domain-containing protein n=1 Tax=Graphocephala atropunctata TaxID=36148 RepID=A0A1B6LDD4_9HEMI
MKSTMLVFILVVVASVSSQNISYLTIDKECGKQDALCDTEATCCLGLTCVNTTANGTQAPYHCEMEELALRAINIRMSGTQNANIDVNTGDDNPVNIDVHSHTVGGCKHCQGQKPYGMAGQEENGMAELMGSGMAGLRENGMAGQRPYGMAGRRENGMAEQMGSGIDGLSNYGMAKQIENGMGRPKRRPCKKQRPCYLRNR